MIANGVLMALASDPILSSGLKYSYMDTLSLVLMIITVIGGTYHCYLQNKKGDNNDFITRFMCLGIPVVVRVLVVALPVGIVIGAIEAALGIGAETDEFGVDVYTTTATQVAVVLFFTVICYAYLGKYIRAISAQQGAGADAGAAKPPPRGSA